MLTEFRDFIIKGNAFELAVGIIIGAAFTTVVNSLVNDLLMPPIGYLLGGVDFSNYYIDLTAAAASVIGETAAAFATIDEARNAGHAVIAYGAFINAIINLLIVGLALYLVVKQVNRLRREEPAAPAAPPEDVKLLTEIRDLLAGQAGAPASRGRKPPQT
jgi:large conductance mechanosensitive channel